MDILLVSSAAPTAQPPQNSSKPSPLAAIKGFFKRFFGPRPAEHNELPELPQLPREVIERIVSFLSYKDCQQAEKVSALFMVCVARRLNQLLPEPLREHLPKTPVPLVHSSMLAHPTPTKTGRLNLRKSKDAVHTTPYIEGITDIDHPVVRVMEPHGRLAFAIRYQDTSNDSTGCIILYPENHEADATWMVSAQAPFFRNLANQKDSDYLHRFLSGEAVGSMMIPRNGDDPSEAPQSTLRRFIAAVQLAAESSARSNSDSPE